MTFRTLTAPELQKVADFFVVDVEVANPEKGASKKELLAALAAGDEPVTWDDYENIYLVAQAREQVQKPVEPEVIVEDVPVVPVDKSDWLLIKMERQNFRYDIRGVTFTKEHPFATMPPKDAEFVIRNVEGFRLAMPSEVQDYYN